MEPQVQKLVNKVWKSYLNTPQDQRLCKSTRYGPFASHSFSPDDYYTTSYMP